MPRPAASARRTLKVGVLATDLRFVDQPILVGHYEQDPISGPEALIDAELLAGELQQRYQLGVYLARWAAPWRCCRRPSPWRKRAAACAARSSAGWVPSMARWPPTSCAAPCVPACCATCCRRPTSSDAGPGRRTCRRCCWDTTPPPPSPSPIRSKPWCAARSTPTPSSSARPGCRCTSRRSTWWSCTSTRRSRPPTSCAGSAHACPPRRDARTPCWSLPASWRRAKAGGPGSRRCRARAIGRV